MEVIETYIKDLKVIKPKVFGDSRGWFTEVYNKEILLSNNIDIEFIQDNHSYSAQKNTLRGLHLQLTPKSQTKLVRCTRGAIYDVAVDVRKDSTTFGKWFGIELTAENKQQLLIPQGFAHGFLTLVDDTEVQYKVDNLYAPDLDRSIKWDDESININWPLNCEPILSEKDKKAVTLNELKSQF